MIRKLLEILSVKRKRKVASCLYVCFFVSPLDMNNKTKGENKRLGVPGGGGLCMVPVYCVPVLYAALHPSYSLVTVLYLFSFVVGGVTKKGESK